MGCVRKLEIFDKEADLVTFAARLWHEIVAESIAARGCMDVALSGGKTPVHAYKALARDGSFPWNDIRIFQVDERFVPQDHEASNYRMIRETLLDRVLIPETNVHPVNTGASSTNEAAKAYEEELTGYFRLDQGSFPRFDLIMLGLGEDGHTASLFPGSPSTTDTEHLVNAVMLGNVLHDRITLTIPVINNARNIVFLVEGRRKAAALSRVMEKKDPGLPASLIEPVDGRLFFLVDREAAGLLSTAGVKA